jgi:hypothetical protein
MDNVQVQAKTTTSVKVAGKEFDKVTFIALSAVAISFGIFAFASIIGAVATVGLGGLAKSWFVAIGLV